MKKKRIEKDPVTGFPLWPDQKQALKIAEQEGVIKTLREELERLRPGPPLLISDLYDPTPLKLPEKPEPKKDAGKVVLQRKIGQLQDEVEDLKLKLQMTEVAASAPTVTWIPVSVELPESMLVDVLACNGGEVVAASYSMTRGRWEAMADAEPLFNVTHWCHLPKGP